MSRKIKYVYIVGLFFLFLSSCAGLGQEGDIKGKMTGPFTATSKLAVVIVPVADAIGGGPNKSELNKNRFTKLPCSYPNSVEYPLNRMHQILYNQVIKICAVRGKEFKVEFPNLFLQSEAQKSPQPLTAWILQNSVVLFKNLRRRNVRVENIPYPLQERTRQRVATLRFPYHIVSHRRSYSAGTRFVLEREEKDQLVVWALNPHRLKDEKVYIPKKLCLINDRKTIEKKIADYVRLVKLWSNLEKGYIPYILGGASWINKCNSSNAMTSYPFRDAKGVSVTSNGRKCYVFDRKKMTKGVKTGYDCSSLIYSAAQAAGIPYYYKNTTTALNRLAKAKKGDKLEKGDIVWRPGHVLVVTEVEGGLKLSQARGYSSGYGRLYEEKGKVLFKGANTAEKFMSDYILGKPLVRLRKSGAVSKTFKKWHILKIKSAWNGPSVIKGNAAFINFKREINEKSR